MVITADEGLRGGRKVPLKANVDEAIKRLDADLVDHVIVVRRTGGSVAMEAGRDVYYDEAAEQVTDECPAVAVEAEHPLFILYTSGSTGQPKGVVHTTGGYLVYASMTHEYVFDYREGDVYWCTADVGWVTGHSYIVYGPLANGATTLMFEGIPTYPSTSRFWEVVDKHKVNIFYTAPTAIRSLMGGGEGPVKKTSRQSLRVLGSVGEPINPEAWEWYYNVVGDRRCSIVDTWWQTETGGILITPLPGATALKPGSATRPFFGVKPQDGRRRGQGAGRRRARAISASPIPGRARCARSTATMSASSRPTSRPIRASTSPATAPGGTPTATTGSPAEWTTSSTSRVTAWAPPRSSRRWSPTRRSPRRRWWDTRTT